MARIIAAVMRHGDYERAPDVPGAHQPHPLTAEGEASARRAAAELIELAAAERWTIHEEIDTSETLRAWETAAVVAEELTRRLGRTFTFLEYAELAERSVGAAANLTMLEIEEVIRRDPRCGPIPENWKSDSFFRLPLQGAESLLEAGERVLCHLERRLSGIAGMVRADTLKLFVGHGGAFRHAAARMGVIPLEDAPLLTMRHCGIVGLERRPEGRWIQVFGRWRQRETGVGPSDGAAGPEYDRRQSTADEARCAD